jgi:hypothetical protein
MEAAVWSGCQAERCLQGFANYESADGAARLNHRAPADRGAVRENYGERDISGGTVADRTEATERYYKGAP